MIDINKEAHSAVNNFYSENDLLERIAFKRGYTECFENSKATQAKVIQAQIDVLLKYQQKLGGYDLLSGLLKQEIQIDIYKLQQQLKQLES
jgi:hypothetical protein